MSTIDVYQRMGCWDGDTAVPPQTYEKLLDAFLYSWDTQKYMAGWLVGGDWNMTFICFHIFWE